MKFKIHRLLIASVVLPISNMPASVRVLIETAPSLSVVMENSHVRVRYGSTGYARGALLEFLDKSTGYDAAGSAANERQTLDNSARSAPLTKARMVWQTHSEAAVELLWGTGEQRTDAWDPENKRQIVVMRADSPVLELIYISKWHIFEWGAERATGVGAIHVPGAAEWARQKGLTNPYFHHKETGFDGSGTFFQRERDGLDVPFNYRGYVIMGVYNCEGRGFVRVMPLDKIAHLKFMGPPLCGFETYRNTPGMVCHLAPVSGGIAEIEALGRAIVDAALAVRIPVRRP